MCDLQVVMKYDRTSEFSIDSPYNCQKDADDEEDNEEGENDDKSLTYDLPVKSNKTKVVGTSKSNFFTYVDFSLTPFEIGALDNEERHLAESLFGKQLVGTSGKAKKSELFYFPFLIMLLKDKQINHSK
jgi:hypothetical protein